LGLPFGQGGVGIRISAHEGGDHQGFQAFKDYAINYYGFNAKTVLVQINFNGYPAYRNLAVSPAGMIPFMY
jgi:hypothetical protein